MLREWRWYFGFLGIIALLVLLALLLSGCGGRVDRSVQSPLETDAGIGVSRSDRPGAEGVPQWTDVAAGTFAGNASGTAVVYEKDGIRNLRLERFSSDCREGRIYLSDGEERVDLGRTTEFLVIPSFVDIKKYDEVVVWCAADGTVHGRAVMS